MASNLPIKNRLNLLKQQHITVITQSYYKEICWSVNANILCVNGS